VNGAARTIGWADELAAGSDCEYELFLAPVGFRCLVKKRDFRYRADILYQRNHRLPKGVCLTHGNLAASGLDAMETLNFNSQDAWLHSARCSIW